MHFTDKQEAHLFLSGLKAATLQCILAPKTEGVVCSVYLVLIKDVRRILLALL